MEVYEKVARHIKENDRLFEFTEAEILEVSQGRVKLKMKVKEKHLNGVGVCQGGVIFTFADLAFAIASNSYGKVALALQSQISFMKPARLNDVLVADAEEVTRTKRTALYRIKVYKEDDEETIAFCTGLAYVTDSTYDF